MSKETLKYTNNEVTVVWKPKVCIHSTICWKGLIEVFNPKQRPWINMDGTPTGRIIEQVRKCPSGALSYFMNDAPPAESPETVVSEAAAIMKIEVTANGPYVIDTKCVIIH